MQNPFANLNPATLLPYDYNDLTTDGQREARLYVAALGGSPKAEVWGWTFFRNHYLVPDEAARFFPGFYKPPVYAPSDLHFRIIQWFFSFPLLCVAAPRGSAKTTTVQTQQLRTFLTRPGRVGTFYTSTATRGSRYGGLIREQLESNERILADFGKMKPNRGTRSWSSNDLWGTNGSRLMTFSLDGNIRGNRGDECVIDDPEDDEQIRVDAEKWTKVLEDKLTAVLMPTMDAQSRLLYLGTILSRKAFLFHILEGEDPKFATVEEGGYWQKIKVSAKDKHGTNIWAEKYTDDYLAMMEASLGRAKLSAEFYNEPLSDEATLFKLNETNHGYTLRAVGGTALRGPTLEPYSPDLEVEYREVVKGVPSTRIAKFSDLLGGMVRGISVDYAPTQNASSDYSAAIVWGLDKKNTLWVLDVWAGKIPPGRLAEELIKLAVRWKVRLISNEAVGIQLELHNRLAERRAEFFETQGWSFQNYLVKYQGNLDKASRIANLEFRFDAASIKLPFERRSERLAGSWSAGVGELFRQLELFTLNLENLRHDDVIDALAQAQYAIRGSAAQPPDEPEKLTVEEKVADGQLHLEGTNIPLLGTMDLSQLPPALRRRLRVAFAEKQRERASGPPHRWEDWDWGGNLLGDLEPELEDQWL